MSSALDRFERSLVTASRALYEDAQTQRTHATEQTGRPPAGRRGGRGFRTRRLVFSFAALAVVTGGVAAAQSLLSPSVRLAVGRVNCFDSTSGTQLARVDSSEPNYNAESPISLCRVDYRSNGYRVNSSRTGPKLAVVPLVACQQNATTVSVYVASGQSDQCQRIGERPLPTTYSPARVRLRSLQRALIALQDEHDCTTPAALAVGVRAVLAGQSFSGWRVVMDPSNPGWFYGHRDPAGTGGVCGWYGLDTDRQSVFVRLGPRRSIGLELTRISAELYAATYDHCYTAASIGALVQRAFTGTSLRPRFAITAPQGDLDLTVSPRLKQLYRQGKIPARVYQQASRSASQNRRRYQQGCVSPRGLILPGNNNRFADVVFTARNGIRLPAGQFYPPASAFQR
ncbi:MAG: hypothetical protein ACLPTJ_13800 [Solirubrobacteraceae bacterium]